MNIKFETLVDVLSRQFKQDIILADCETKLLQGGTVGNVHLADIDHMVEYYRRCVPAYCKGFSEYADVSAITDHCVFEMILLIFGYRLVESYLHTEDDDGKAETVHTLQKIYEMKTSPAQN